jgi:hypothetical protein
MLSFLPLMCNTGFIGVEMVQELIMISDRGQCGTFQISHLEVFLKELA